MAWSDAGQRLEGMPVVRTGRDFAISNRSTLSASTTAACRCRDQSLTAGGLIYDHVSFKYNWLQVFRRADAALLGSG